MKAVAATTLLVLCSVAIAPSQTGTSAPPPAQGKQKGMMQGGRSGMMEHCQMRQHMQTCMRNAHGGDSKAGSPGAHGEEHRHHRGSAPPK
jgi:Spy/CpxP family protein refolding chaperone